MQNKLPNVQVPTFAIPGYASDEMGYKSIEYVPKEKFDAVVDALAAALKNIPCGPHTEADGGYCFKCATLKELGE